MERLGICKTGVCFLLVIFMMASCKEAGKADTQTTNTSRIQAVSMGSSEASSTDIAEKIPGGDALLETAGVKTEAELSLAKLTTAQEEETELFICETDISEITRAMPVEETFGKQISDIYDEIAEKVELHMPIILSDERIFHSYGIDVGILEEYVFSVSEEASSEETIIILNVKDSKEMESIKTSLQIIVDQKRSEAKKNLSNQFSILDSCFVQIKGNYVYLVISEHADDICQIIQNGIQ